MVVHLLAIALSLVVMANGPAFAQQGPGPDRMLSRMDADRDGRISQDEWLGPPPAFARIDADADGFLTRDELQALPGRRGAGQGRPDPQTPSAKAPLAWIDTHMHLRRGSGTYEGAVSRAVALMDQAGISMAVLLPPPFADAGHAKNRYDVEELARLTRVFPGRFLFLSGGGSINAIIERTPPDQVTDALQAEFVHKAESILNAGARGFGELGVMHLALFPGHPSYRVRPDHPLFLVLADIAAEHDAVMDIHMDLVERDAATPKRLERFGNPRRLDSNLAAFERLLAHNRGAKIVLAHAGWDVTGQWSAAVSRRLLSAHPNLYMSLKIVSRGARLKNRLVSGQPPKVVDDWLTVFMAFPERFVIGSDSFVAEPGATGAAPGGVTQFHGGLIASFLDSLPADLAQRFASENALALYGGP